MAETTTPTFSALVTPSAPAPVDALRADRRDALRKLAVGGAIVWSAPMITSSISAAAAASVPACTPRVLDWDIWATGSTFTSSNVFGTTVALSSTFSGGTAALGTNRTIVAAPQGGINQKALRFEQTPISNGRQTVTFTFSAPVKSVSFSFFDIDNLTGNWSDRIVILTTPFGYAIPATSTITGNGTAATPFQNSQSNANLPNTSGAGNVTVSLAGPLSAFSFTFGCGAVAGGQNQLINIGDISFCR